MYTARRLALRILPIAVATFVAACGPSQQQGGFQGFPPSEVTTFVVEPKAVPASYEYVGQTAGSKEVEVRARVTGILERKLFQEGAPVKAGQVLFVIDPKPLAAQAAALEADVVRAQALKAQSDREVARLKPLAEKRAVGQKEADDAMSNAELAAASVKAAQAKLDEVKLSLGYTRVVAPIGGLSSRAPKSEGSLVTANDTLLTTISQSNPIWIPFAISENEQLSLNRAVGEGRLTLPKDNAYDVTVKLADGTTIPRRGRINFADTRINPATGTFEMRAEIPNADGVLKPGQFVRVSLAGAVRNNALTVPQTAVLNGVQGKFVYVADRDKDGKDVASARPVTLGDWVNIGGSNLWVVETGLKAGDKVIIDGLSKLHPGAPIKLGGSGTPPGAPPAAAGGLAPGAPAGAPANDSAKPAAAPKS
jgi:membrane fusion protein, multidrug efflux system